MRRRSVRIPLGRKLSAPRGVRLAMALLGTLALALVVWADRTGHLAYDGEDWTRYHGHSFKVTRVLDGDTLDIDAPDGERATTRIRVWGINAPEIDHPRFQKKGHVLGPAAAELARRLVEGKTVRLSLQQHRLRDDFKPGRVLAYVQLPDGGDLGEQLLLAGLAISDDRGNDRRFMHERLERYNLMQWQAKSRRVGLWAPGVPSIHVKSGSEPAGAVR